MPWDDDWENQELVNAYAGISVSLFADIATLDITSIAPEDVPKFIIAEFPAVSLTTEYNITALGGNAPTWLLALSDVPAMRGGAYKGVLVLAPNANPGASSNSAMRRRTFMVALICSNSLSESGSSPQRLSRQPPE